MRTSILAFLPLLLASFASAAVPAKRVPANQLFKRSVQLGWSLQASSCPAGSNSCGGGSCCPSSLYCLPAANDEVAACCPTASVCRGAVEGAPTCADSSWSLWKGLNGNGFCCPVGQVGIYDYHNPIAGWCVDSDPAGATQAVLMSVGSGGSASTSVAPTTTPTTTSVPPTTVPPTTSTVPTTTVTSTTFSTTTVCPSACSSTGSASPGSTGKPVFFHYMVGTITDAHCEQDILDAQALGADAFALNINTVTASWATTTVTSLFKWANVHGFKLFFSFDMTGFNNANEFTSFLQSYVTNAAHYTYNGLPFVSTFNGGASSYTFGTANVSDGWAAWQQTMASSGHPIYFVPAFQDFSASSEFFTTFPSLNGAMNWNAWPQNTQGDIIVPTTDDVTYLEGAHAAGKTFLMGVSPLQFKHLDSGDNYYRRGEQNLEYRFDQVLSLQPDFIELITWNDAGESHYMGNSWPEPIAGSVIPGYTDGYDHTGYWQILGAFIQAYKAGVTTTGSMYPVNGKKAQGTFWHHTLLVGGDCSADGLGKPQGISAAEDKVTVVVLVEAGITNYKVSISSGGNALGSKNLVPGFNQYSVDGLMTGNVTVAVTDSSNNVIVSGTGPIAVTNSASLCNYNFQVVGLA